MIMICKTSPASLYRTVEGGCPHMNLSSCDSPLFRGLLGRLQSKEFHDHLQVFPGFAFLARVAEKKCGMVGDGEFSPRPRRIAAASAGGQEVIEAAAQF